MVTRAARTGFRAAPLAALFCGLLASSSCGRVLAAWSYDSTILSEGRCYVLRTPLDTGHTNNVKWALNEEGVISYSLDGGLLRILAPIGSGAHPLIAPTCALGGSSFIAPFDAYDGRVKYFNESGGFQDAVLAPTGDASGVGLINRMFSGPEGPVAASFSFADHTARVLRFSRDGVLVATYGSDASSPGRWDWIFDLMAYGSGFMAYVYEGDGQSGRSWIERRAWDGTLIAPILLQRTEGPLPPLWYASRSMRFISGQQNFFALVPGSTAGYTDLVVSKFDGAIVRERLDPSDLLPEPWLRLLEFGANQVAVFGLYPDGHRPGHAYMLDSNINITQTYQQTPGPANKVFHPRGVLPAADGSFIVSDSDNYRLAFCTASGSFLSAAPLPGRPGDLDALPDGGVVAVNLDQETAPELGGLFHVSPGGQFLGDWGAWGAGAGDLAGPSDVAVGPDGNIYIADSLNSRVQVFTASGTPLRRWGAVGESPLHQFRPKAIAVTADRVFTVEDALGGGSRVLVFTPLGAYLREWSTTLSIADLETTPDLKLHALASAGQIVTFDELGRALEVSVALTPAVGNLNAPAALCFSAGKLYVVDTGNSRLVVFSQTTPAARVTSIGPGLLPLARGVRVRILGEQLPADLVAQLVPAGGTALIGAVTWLHPGEAVAQFDLSTVGATAVDLWVSGTGLPATNAGSVVLSAFVSPQLVRRWQRRDVDASGLPAGPASETLIISPEGQVTWQRLDGSGQWRTGVLAATTDTVAFCYTAASPPLGPLTIAHSFAVAGRALTLTALPPFDADGVSYWFAVDGSNLLDPAVSGVWRLTGLDEGSGPVPVTWTESITVDLDGAYTRVSDRSGAGQVSLGQMQAHDGQMSRTEARVAGAQTSETGAYGLPDSDLHVQIATPHPLSEVWHRLAVSGRRPLPWVALQLPPRLYRGIAATAVVVVGNHGSVNAGQVTVDLSLPWLPGAPQRLAVLTTLGPGEVKQYPASVLPPADFPIGPVTATALASVASPESSLVQAPASAVLSDPKLDLSVRLSYPGTATPGVLVPAFVTIDTAGVDPASAIPSGSLDTVALSLARAGAIDIAGSDWPYTASASTLTWRSLLAALSGKTEVTWKIWTRITGSAGAAAALDLVLSLPLGVAEASSEDNFSHAALLIAATTPNVRVNLQPLEGVKPGGRLTALLRLAASTGQTWKLRGVILEVDPLVDLFAATAGASATLDPVGSTVYFTSSGASVTDNPNRTPSFTQVLPIPPQTPIGSRLTFRAIGYFDNMAPVVSEDASVVVTGGLLGDFNGDDKTDSADLAMFVRALRNARQGVYDPLFDLAPTEGVWPTVVSHPDGVLDSLDMRTFLDAFLFHGN
jgi:hypothetical protein